MNAIPKPDLEPPMQTIADNLTATEQHKRSLQLAIDDVERLLLDKLAARVQHRRAIQRAIEDVEWLLLDRQDERLLAIRSRLNRDYDAALGIR